MTKSNVKAKPSIPALPSQASKKRKATIIDLCTGSDDKDCPYKPPKDSTPSDSEEEELGEVAAGAMCHYVATVATSKDACIWRWSAHEFPIISLIARDVFGYSRCQHLC